MDFTIDIYNTLLLTLKKNKYSFHTFSDFLSLSIEDSTKRLILRHDVDKLPQNSLLFARIQAEHGVMGSYYFRAVPDSWDEDIIKEVRDKMKESQ